MKLTIDDIHFIIGPNTESVSKEEDFAESSTAYKFQEMPQTHDNGFGGNSMWLDNMMDQFKIVERAEFDEKEKRRQADKERLEAREKAKEAQAEAVKKQKEEDRKRREKERKE